MRRYRGLENSKKTKNEKQSRIMIEEENKIKKYMSRIKTR